MKQYALIADALVLTPKSMKGWIQRGYVFARTLPPKAAKPKRKATVQVRKAKI